MKLLMIILALTVLVKANSMTGNYQSCSIAIACSDEVDDFSPVIQPPTSRKVQIVQGKSGPRGAKGERGQHGVKGDAGVDCDVNQITQLKKQLVNLTDDLRNSQTETNGLRRTVEALQQTVANLTEIVTGMQVVEKSVAIWGDCKEGLDKGNSTDGVYTIAAGTTRFEVWCDMQGGGWTVFQRRFDGSTDFNQNFATYSRGFGNKEAEYWLGLENLYEMTKIGSWELNVKLLAYDGDEAFANYKDFSIGVGPGYRLHIGTYSGTAGDSLTYNHNGMKFSTADRDQEEDRRNCAEQYEGSWWFNSCFYSNLNAYTYGKAAVGGKGMVWYDFKDGYTPLKQTTMMIRKIN